MQERKEKGKIGVKDAEDLQTMKQKTANYIAQYASNQ